MLRIADHITSAHPVRTGSDVYKVTRGDHQVSAVQVFAITTTVEEDEFFTKQANLLAETVRHYHANVPTVLGWGFTQAGNFPYIETEWIGGYDLDEFIHREEHISVNDLALLAEHISKTLTVCHNEGVVHGDIRPKHICWDESKGRFLLTNFGFGLLSEGRSPYTPSAAPETKDEALLKRKDVHDLGKAILSLLEQHLLPERPRGLTDVKGSLFDMPLKDGSTMPVWLATCIERTIGTNEERFNSAHEMYSYIILHHKTPFQTDRRFRSKLQKPSIISLRDTAKRKGHSRGKLETMVASGVRTGRNKMRFVFDRRIALGLFVAAILVGFSIIAQNRQNGKTSLGRTDSSVQRQLQDTSTNTVAEANDVKVGKHPTQQKKQTARKSSNSATAAVVEQIPSMGTSVQPQVNDTNLGAYKVKSKAYFHNAPSERTRRKGFITHWNNAVLHPLKEQNDFVYVAYTNDEGQTSKGWLRKKDLIKQ